MNDKMYDPSPFNMVDGKWGGIGVRGCLVIIVSVLVFIGLVIYFLIKK